MAVEITLDEYLIFQIEKMIREAIQLKPAQVLTMFRRYGEETVIHHIKDLASRHKVILTMDENQEDIIKKITFASSSHSKSPYSKDAQVRRSKAFWVLAFWGDENIYDYIARSYSNTTQLIWIDARTNQLFDVTYLPPLAVDQTATFWERTHRELLPPLSKDAPYSKEDCCDHIALVRYKEDGEAALQHGFTRYCRLVRVDGEVQPRFCPPIPKLAITEEPTGKEKVSHAEK